MTNPPPGSPGCAVSTQLYSCIPQQTFGSYSFRFGPEPTDQKEFGTLEFHVQSGRPVFIDNVVASRCAPLPELPNQHPTLGVLYEPVC